MLPKLYKGTTTKSPKQTWISLEDAKNRMFSIDKTGLIRYKLRQERKGILELNECIFMQIIFAPRRFVNPKSKIANYKMQVALLQFDYETKVWIIDKEILTVTITVKDYKTLMDEYKIKFGDRVKAFGYRYYLWISGKQIWMKGIRWEVTKRNAPK